LIRELAKRLGYAVAPDPQTLVLLRSGGKGFGNAGAGLLTAWDGWTAPLARKWFGAGADVGQPHSFPQVDLDADDPIAAIVSASEFPALVEFFNVPDPAERALVSADTQALLYALVRNLRPETVIEIGTYRASTSKAMCRALCANGLGFIHTVDPANSAPILKLIRRWEPGLRERLCYYPTSSMEFFDYAAFKRMTSELVFVDGNHDYEYALFDIQCAARLVRPGGFIAIDNINQGGPVYAARDFLRDHPSWRECGRSLAASPCDKAFDLERSTIPDTDLCVIRAPSSYMIGPRLETRGPQKVVQSKVGGVELNIKNPASGTLRAQFVVRVREPVMSEATAETSIDLRDARGLTRVELPWTFAPNEVAIERTIELWLSWSGDGELELGKPPAFF
jgi:predicted O-methyltransferase YrrM